MITFANSLQDPCLVFTITRRDLSVEYITNASHDITVGPTTWTAHPGLIAGVRTSRLDGTPPTMGFQAQLQSGLPLKFSDLVKGQYDGARVQVGMVSQSAPTTPDFVFDGLVMGEVAFDQHGTAAFDLISIFAVPREIMVEQFTLKCRYQFGEWRMCQVRGVFPNDTFPYNEVHDLTDPPARNTAYLSNASQRFRFGSDDTPEDFLNVFLLATVQGGVTGPVAPAFSSVVGALTVDGSQIWETKDAYCRAARIASVDRHTIILDRLPDPRATSDSTWFQPLKFVFRSGVYNSRAFKGNNWDTATLSFETYLPCQFAAIGDWIEISPDCDKTYEMCSQKFNNARNFGGFPFNIGAKAQTQQLGLT